MQVKFLETIMIQNKFKVNKGDILNAEEYNGVSYVITLKNKRKTVAPKSALGSIFEIVE